MKNLIKKAAPPALAESFEVLAKMPAERQRIDTDQRQDKSEQSMPRLRPDRYSGCGRILNHTIGS